MHDNVLYIYTPLYILVFTLKLIFHPNLVETQNDAVMAMFAWLSAWINPYTSIVIVCHEFNKYFPQITLPENIAVENTYYHLMVTCYNLLVIPLYILNEFMLSCNNISDEECTNTPLVMVTCTSREHNNSYVHIWNNHWNYQFIMLPCDTIFAHWWK